MPLSNSTRTLLIDNAIRVFVAALVFTAVKIFSVEGLAVAILAALVLLSIDITRRIRKYTRDKELPDELQPDRQKLIDAHNAAKGHELLTEWMKSLRHEHHRSLEKIADGEITFTSVGVHEISLTAMELVANRCILVFPINKHQASLAASNSASNALSYEQQKIEEMSECYYKKMLEANQRLAEQGVSEGITRVFIIERNSDIIPKSIELINRCHADGIDIRFVIERSINPPEGVRDLDFGYFSGEHDDWIMVLGQSDISSEHDPGVLQYSILTSGEEVSKYCSFADELLALGKTRNEFMDYLKKPLNDQWPGYFAANNGFEMDEPHGLSDSEADEIRRQVEFLAKKRGGESPCHVLVLGRTPRILSRLSREAKEKGKLVITSLDAIPASDLPPHQKYPNVDYIDGNWLTKLTEQDENRYDAIVFDEALNNMSLVQLNFIFPILKRILSIDGHILGRMLGRFNDSDVYNSGRSGGLELVIERLERLRVRIVDQKRTPTHEMFASQIISDILTYDIGVVDSASHVLDCAAWNRQIAEMSHLPDSDRVLWRLPFEFRLLVPTTEVLRREAAQVGLSFSPNSERLGDYQNSHADISKFYRLVTFRPSHQS